MSTESVDVADEFESTWITGSLFEESRETIESGRRVVWPEFATLAYLPTRKRNEIHRNLRLDL